MYRTRHILLFCLLVCLAAPIRATASQVYKVNNAKRRALVTQDKNRKWRKGDSVCVVSSAGTVGCGKVAKATNKLALVAFSKLTGVLKRGQRVMKYGTESTDDPLAALDKPPGLTPEERSSVSLLRDPTTATKAQLYDEFVRQTNSSGGSSRQSVTPVDHSGDWSSDLTLGANAGFNHFFPVLHYQLKLSEAFAFGIAPLFFSAGLEDTTVTAFGGFLTINYYDKAMFRGLWGQFGLGTYHFNASQDASGSIAAQSENSLSAAVLITAGWRFGWEKGINIGFAGGFQFVTSPKISLVSIDFKNFQPSVLVDIGLNF